MDIPIHGAPGAADSIPFVGRVRELERLRSLHKASVEQGQGAFLTFEGEPGIGKSRLIQEFLESLTRSRTLILQARGYEDDISATRIYAELIRDFLRMSGKKVRTLLSLLDPPMVEDLRKIVPELAGLVPFETTPEPNGATLSPEAKRQRFFDSLLRFFGRLATRKPLVLLFEDIHWLPHDSLEVLRYLVTNLQRQPVLILATVREAVPGAHHDRVLSRLSDQRLAEVLTLSPLTSEEIRDLVIQILGSEEGERVSDWLAPRSSGNPLFALELLRSLHEQGWIQYHAEEGRWESRQDLKSQEIPRTVRSVIERRLEILDEDHRNVLTRASVLGDRFPVSTLSDISENFPEDTESALTALDRFHILERESQQGDLAYCRFRHSLLRQTVYEDMAGSEKRKLHALVGHHLEARCQGEPERITELVDELAYHFSRSGRDREDIEKAVHYLTLSGRASLQRHAPAQASETLRAALGLLTSLPSDNEQAVARLEVLTGLGECHLALGEFEDSVEHFQKGLSSLPEAGSGDNARTLAAANLYRQMGWAYLKGGKLRLSEQTLERALQEIGESRNVEALKLRAKALQNLGSVFFKMGDNERAIEATERGISITHHDQQLQHELADLYNNLGAIHWSRGLYDQAIDAFQRGLAIEKALSDVLDVAGLLNNLGLVYWNQGKLTLALQNMEESLEIKRRHGDVYGEASAYNNLGVIHQDLGRYEETVEYYRRDLEIRTRIGDDYGRAISLGNLGEVLARLGDLKPAEEYLDRAVDLCETIEARNLLPGVYLSKGEVALKASRLDEALQWCERCDALSEQLDAKLSMAVCNGLKARVRSAAGSWKEARLAFEEAEDSLSQLGSRSEMARLLFYRAVSAASQPEEFEVGRTHLKRSLDIYREIGADSMLSRISTELEVLQLYELLPAEVPQPPEAVPAPSYSVSEPPPPRNALRVYLFDRLRVFRPGDDEEIPAREWTSGKARMILAYMVSTDAGGHGIARERLVEAIWPEQEPAAVENTFHVTLSYLRKALRARTEKKGERAPGTAKAILYKGGAYMLNSEITLWTDAERFQELARQGLSLLEGSETDAGLARLRSAVEIYAGDFLPEVYDDWADPLRDRYRSSYRMALLRLAVHFGETGDLDLSTDYAQKLLMVEPTDEEAHRTISRNLLARGNRSAALRQLQSCEDILKRELGVELSEETEQLRTQLQT